MSDADVIKAKLKQIRRRHFLIQLLRHSSVALVGFAFWLLLCGMEIFPWQRPSAFVQLIACAAMASAVVAISVFKIPSLKETAKIADISLGLQQRLETSWECIPPREDIEHLLLRDTSHKIIAIRPSMVIPVRFDRSTNKLLLVCLLATTALGIVRILESWNPGYLPQNGTAPQSAANSSPQSQNAKNTNMAKRHINSPGRAQASADNPSNTQSGRNSLPQGFDRALNSDSEQTQIQPVQGPPSTSKPDDGDGRPQGGLSIASGASKPEIENGSADASVQGGKKVPVPQDKGYSNGGSTIPDVSFRPNAGARSVRKSSQVSGQYANTSASLKEVANGGSISGGRSGRSLNKSAFIRKDVRFSGELSLENPAFWLAVEQALQKEKIPPGFKKYIADYFRAIHP